MWPTWPAVCNNFSKFSFCCFQNNYAQLDISAGTTPKDIPIQVTVDYSKIKFQVEYTTVTISNRAAGDDIKHPLPVSTVNYSVVTHTN